MPWRAISEILDLKKFPIYSSGLNELRDIVFKAIIIEGLVASAIAIILYAIRIFPAWRSDLPFYIMVVCINIPGITWLFSSKFHIRRGLELSRYSFIILMQLFSIAGYVYRDDPSMGLSLMIINVLYASMAVGTTGIILITIIVPIQFFLFDSLGVMSFGDSLSNVFLYLFVTLLAVTFTYSVERMAKLNRKYLSEIELLYQGNRKLFREITHKLKTPVAMLKTHPTLASLANQNEQMRLLIGDVEEVVDEMIKLSRLTLSMSSNDVKDVDLAEFFKKIEADLRLVEKSYSDQYKSGVEVKITLGKKIKKGVLARVSPGKIREAVFNLIDNAFTHGYQKNSETKCVVEIDVTLVGNSFQIKVKDFGKGMSSQKLREVLMEIKSNEQELQERNQNIGIRIVRRVVDSYGGRFEIESEEGKGTEVKLEMPLNPVYQI